MSYAKMTPSDIEKMFTIPLTDMPKMSSPTNGKPTYTTMDTFQQAINKQALSIPSATYPDLGWIGLVISPAEFDSINNNVHFVAPVNPGLTPTHQANPTAAQITENVRLHELTQNEFHAYNHTRIQLRNMILNNIEDKYVRTLSHPVTSYNQVSPLNLLNHLWTTYGQITEADLSANEERMYANWHPPTPIETLYEQLVDGQKFAAKGNEVIDDSQLVRKSYDIVKKTGLFEDDCKRWRAKPDAERTWPDFQIYFAAADDDRRKNVPTTSAAGYSTNNIEEIVKEEMNQIFQTWIHDNNDIKNPSSIDEMPPTENINATSTLDELLKEIKRLQQQSQRNNPRTYRKEKPPAQGTDDNGDHITYCWSHGVTKNLWHNSTTCNRPKEGHKKEATLQNKMGGCETRCKPRPT
jgi:hypothetical protein